MTSRAVLTLTLALGQSAHAQGVPAPTAQGNAQVSAAVSPAPASSTPATPATPAPANPAPAAPTDALLPGPGRAPLRLHSTGVSLHIATIVPGVRVHSARYDVVSALTREVCVTPCTVYVPPGAFSFEVTGPGVAGYSVSASAPAELVLRTPSAALSGAAAGVLIVGVIGVIVGAGVLIGDAVFPRAAGTGGMVLASAGGAATVAGGVMLGVNRGGVAERRALSEPAAGAANSARVEWGAGPTSAWVRF